MKITEVIRVQRDPDAVWELFNDVPELAHCLPGAELDEVHGDGSYSGKVSVRLGPLTATFEGKATVVSDHATRSGTVDGKGVDRRGGSRGQVKVQYAIEPGDEATLVTVDADVLLSGAAAQFGRTGLIKEMSTRLIDEFVRCVEAKLAAGTKAAAAEITAGEVRGFSLFLSSVIASIVRFVKRRFSRRRG
ncbi:MAG: SRPBCC family protein [Acidimicrobiia bacterium]|nr:SRPBCC family protein [Acidimicrobiia bacterium]